MPPIWTLEFMRVVTYATGTPRGCARNTPPALRDVPELM
jgi:hypothetical protein